MPPADGSPNAKRDDGGASSFVVRNGALRVKPEDGRTRAKGGVV